MCVPWLALFRAAVLAVSASACADEPEGKSTQVSRRAEVWAPTVSSERRGLGEDPPAIATTPPEVGSGRLRTDQLTVSETTDIEQALLFDLRQDALTLLCSFLARLTHSGGS